MAKTQKNAISPTRVEDYPEWYQRVIKAADLAEASPVRGCMVIKPWGYAIWENMQKVLDRMFKDTGHVNAYFPLLIPLSYFEREAEHVKGFAKECAVVTHHRLEPKESGGLAPAGELDEPLVIRPTSETIIGEMYAKWVQSYRDLPIMINQWANVVRWELRTRLFLRTTEFLWQEGHTAHATSDEAVEETRQMLDVYADFAENFMAMPVIKGEKTRDERFPGALATYSIEAMMQDHKALQAGTSHFLGQNFAKACGIQFLSKEGKEEHAWTTSWGASTRLIGGLIMTHSDDDGLVLPPRLAPRHVVVIPIHRNDEERSQVLEFSNDLATALRCQSFGQGRIEVEVDERDLRGGEKVWQHIKQGVPIRLEIGPRDMAADSVFLGRRDKGVKEKASVSRAEFIATAGDILEDIQKTLYERALKFRQDRTRKIDDVKEFEEYFTPSEGEVFPGGFALSHWVDDPRAVEILQRLKVTKRCIPLSDNEEEGTCIFTGKPSKQRVVFAKAY